VNLYSNKHQIVSMLLLFQNLYHVARQSSLNYTDIWKKRFKMDLEHVSVIVVSLKLDVSGVPGTGKTATFKAVLRSLQARVEDDDLEPFEFVEINGMRLSEPQQAYSALWEGLTGNRVSPAHAEELLSDRFNKPNKSRTPVVVLMDELDLLVTKNQKVVYNFFNWPNCRYSQLIVVGIANTMDLPERMLTNKVNSRLGMTKMIFETYKHTQLMEIITSRLEGLKCFHPDAIQFAARKVASVSGDARRCLDICRYPQD
jgi:origin recognition complex subunit 1